MVGGLFAGATTNTPSLAAAQAALQVLPTYNAVSGDYLGMAYAVAYPFGIILTMLLVRRIFSIDVGAEVRKVELSLKAGERTPGFIDLEVTNPNVDGVALRDLPFAAEAGLVFSRTGITKSDQPLVAYAAVYPLVMILRVFMRRCPSVPGCSRIAVGRRRP